MACFLPDEGDESFELSDHLSVHHSDQFVRLRRQLWFQQPADRRFPQEPHGGQLANGAARDRTAEDREE